MVKKDYYGNVVLSLACSLFEVRSMPLIITTMDMEFKDKIKLYCFPEGFTREFGYYVSNVSW